jgi:hypothetical protein
MLLILVFTAFAVTAQPAPDESNPLIASVIVYSQAYSIERWQSYCSKENPESEQAISAARTKWLEQHAALYGKAAQILQSQYTKEQRVNIAVQAKLTNNELEAKLASASPQERKQWCQESPMRIADRHMNLLARGKLVKAITEFKVSP